MSKITLDPGLRAKLNGLTEPFEVCDESGTTVGHFLPTGDYEKLMYRLAETQCPYTSEQLAQMRRQHSGMPLKDFLAALGRP